MMTLRQLAAEPLTLPTRTTWYLTDLAEARGKQELFTRQSPQKLKVLREHALIESAISSNRIEGVEVDKSRVGTLVFGKPALRDRDEEEVRGYRDALKLSQLKSARGEKTEAVLAAIGRAISTFRVADLQAQCPGVGLDLIRQILSHLQKEGKAKALGTGRSARWGKLGN
jgi:hypothetical protein